MSRRAFWVSCAGALAIGLAFRLTALDARPLHNDEANQAIRFGILLETGEYHYDRHDHHGPTLYYLTLPFAWIRGQRAIAALDEHTIRVVPAVFGAGTLLLFLALAGAIGRGAAAAAAALAAISPMVVYYNRFYIQESMFVFFVLAFVIALGFYAMRPRMGAAIAAGLAAGLAYATKETSIILLPLAVVACIAALKGCAATVRTPVMRRFTGAAAAAVLAGFLVPTVVFYTSFFRNPAGFFDSFSAFSIYFSRGVDPGPHVHPWHTYLQMLSWSSSGGLWWTEGLILVLAALGAIHAIAVRRTSFWAFYICGYALLATAVFSAIPYKTPWNALPFYTGIILLAGIGLASLCARVRPPIARVVLAIALAAAGWHLGVQTVRANFRYAADPRNPYVYAHTSTDFMKLVDRVRDVAAVHPEGRRMLVKMIAGPYEQWPLPWYLRDFAHVGYWIRADEASPLDGTPVIVASQDHAASVEAMIGDRYISEFYGLRPSVLLTVYIERGLWERFLQTRQ